MNALEQALTGVNKLAFDTAPLIYFIERHPTYLVLMRDIIRRIDEGLLLGYSSVITLTEVLVKPKQLKNIAIERAYYELLNNSRYFKLIAIDAAVAEQTATLRSCYNLKTPDALQIAAALSVNCEAFLTNDKKLKVVKELQILVLEELL